MSLISKTELTKNLEKQIWNATNKLGIFGCFEVTIGFHGQERVDYLTYDTNKGIWRCYEIKVSKNDFYSKAKKTFVGHYNYYVMPEELYKQVKNEIPTHIGVYVGGKCVKKATRQELDIDEQILKDSLIRSLHREAQKVIMAETPNIINLLNKKVSYLEKQLKIYQNKYNSLLQFCEEKLGSDWYEEMVNFKAYRKILP